MPLANSQVRLKPIKTDLDQNESELETEQYWIQPVKTQKTPSPVVIRYVSPTREIFEETKFQRDDSDRNLLFSRLQLKYTNLEKKYMDLENRLKLAMIKRDLKTDRKVMQFEVLGLAK